MSGVDDREVSSGVKVGLHVRVKLSRGSPTLKKRSLTCNRLRNPTIAGHGNLAEIRLEGISFGCVK